MRRKNNLTKRIVYLVACFSLLFQQMGFAQVAAELNIAGYLSRMQGSIATDKFRPLHLRYFSYDLTSDNFKFLFDKGDAFVTKDERGGTKDDEQKLQAATQELLRYFLIGIALPDSKFWVNLRPDSIGQIIEPELESTDLGKVLLEADLQLKRDTAQMTSPQTPEGRAYWNRLYKKAEELYGSETVTIPTLTRPWIVPGEIIIRETQDSSFIYKSTLKVMLEEDYLQEVKGERSKVKGVDYNFKDQRAKALNEYSTQLIRELIIPKLTKEVNTSKKYAALRQVFYSLILSRWFKARFAGKRGLSPQGAVPFYTSLIDSGNLNGLTSQEPWSKTTYFQQYQKSFTDGEYNIKESVYTPTGQVIRSYFSGGIVPIPNSQQLSGMAGTRQAHFEANPNLIPGDNTIIPLKVSGSPVSVSQAVDTNVIFFDFGQVLGTQIEDYVDETIDILMSRSKLNAEMTGSSMDKFKEGLRRLLIPDSEKSYLDCPSRHELHRDAKYFADWLKAINNYLKEYGGQEINEEELKKAFYGPMKPNPTIKNHLDELIRIKTKLNIRFGVISNYEAAGREAMFKLFSEHYPGLIDEELVVISGTIGYVKTDGPQAFTEALRRFRESFKEEPRNPVFIDNQIPKQAANAQRAGFRHLIHYAFAGGIAPNRDDGLLKAKLYEYDGPEKEISVLQALCTSAAASPKASSAIEDEWEKRRRAEELWSERRGRALRGEPDFWNEGLGNYLTPQERENRERQRARDFGIAYEDWKDGKRGSGSPITVRDILQEPIVRAFSDYNEVVRHSEPRSLGLPAAQVVLLQEVGRALKEESLMSVTGKDLLLSGNMIEAFSDYNEVVRRSEPRSLDLPAAQLALLEKIIAIKSAGSPMVNTEGREKTDEGRAAGSSPLVSEEMVGKVDVGDNKQWIIKVQFSPGDRIYIIKLLFNKHIYAMHVTVNPDLMFIIDASLHSLPDEILGTTTKLCEQARQSVTVQAIDTIVPVLEKIASYDTITLFAKGSIGGVKGPEENVSNVNFWDSLVAVCSLLSRGDSTWSFEIKKGTGVEKIKVQLLDEAGISEAAAGSPMVNTEGQERMDDGRAAGSAMQMQQNEAEFGGIDFRVMNIVTQPLVASSSLNLKLPQTANLAEVNLDEEFKQIQGMLSAGIMPSGERIKELMASSALQGEWDRRVGQIVSCLVEVCRLEEDSVVETPLAIKEALILADSAVLGG